VGFLDVTTAPLLRVEGVVITEAYQNQGYETLALVLLKLLLLVEGREGAVLDAWFGRFSLAGTYSQAAFSRVFMKEPWSDEERGQNVRITYQLTANEELRAFLRSLRGEHP